MIHLMLAVAISATPKYALPLMKAAELKPGMNEVFTDHLAQQLTDRGLSIVTASDIAAVLGIERQKQLAGCAEESCTIELAGALGVEGVVLGSVAKVGSTYLVNVRALSSANGQTRATFSETVRVEDEVPVALERAADSLAATLGGTTPGRRMGASFFVPLGVGVLSGIGAGIFGGLAADAHRKLLNDKVADPLFDVRALQANGQTAAMAAYILTAVAVTAVATAFTLWLMGVGS